MPITAFLNGLSAASTSPYAFVAYLVVVLAWLAIAFRVRRNKNLLDVIDKIPADQRLAAIQAEMGNVSPPPGLTPEQWLKSKNYNYYFIGFLTLCFCATVLILVAYLNAPDDPKKTTVSDLTLFDEDSKNAPDGDEKADNELTYTGSQNADGTLSIQPSMPYLTKLQNRQEVDGISGQPFQWKYPAVSIKLVNNSKSDLVMSEIQFEVLNAIVDLRPIPLIHQNRYNVKHLEIVNDGWGSMEDVKLEIAGWKRSGDDYARPCSEPNELIGEKSEIKLQPIEESFDVDLSKLIPAEYRTERDACVVGSINYKTAAGGEDDTFKFRGLVSLVRPGPGAALPPSATYKLFLPAGKKDYVAVVPVSNQIKPGEADNIVVRMASDKSGSFRLRYRAKLVSNLMVGNQTFNLGIFIPRSGAKRGKLDPSVFPELPAAAWNSIPTASLIRRVAFNPDNKSDVRIFLKEEGDQVKSCDEIYNQIAERLRQPDFPSTVRISVIDKEGETLCRSGD